MTGHWRPGALTVLLMALALLLLPPFRGVFAAMPPDGLSAIDVCVGRLNPDIDVGYERVAAQCPELAQRLNASAWAPWLPRDWSRPGNDLSAAGLLELRELIVREAAPRSQGRVPDVAPVRDILARLEQEKPQHVGWWERTKAWVRTFWARDEEEAGWATGLVGQVGLSQVVIEVVSYIALGVVLVLAVFIVVNELRVARVVGVLRARLGGFRMGRVLVRRARPRAVGSVDGSVARSWSWEDAVDKAEPAQRPCLLLELVVARLSRERFLPPARGLTVHELIRAARLRDAGDRQRLVELARVSELVRFSGGVVREERLEAAVESGRALLEARLD